MTMKTRTHASQSPFLWRSPWALALLFALLLPPLTAAGANQASFVPWSGYWWPFTQGGLGTGQDYRGRPAPLEKYNFLMTGATSGDPLDKYMDAYYDPDAPGWYGLCVFWALAASSENVNVLPSSEQNVVFRVGDKKGLLTLVHDSDLVEMSANHSPDVFHFWLLHYIRDQKKGFIADLSAGEEVWSFPIYRYDMVSTRNGSVESVSVKIYYADDAVRPDYMGTRVLTSDYTYDLFLNGSGEITGGQWTGYSVANHPEYIRTSLSVGANLTGLDYQEVLRLARSKDDFLENGSQPVEIGPGTYNLILLDEDVYRIPAKPGDILSLRIEKESGSAEEIEAVITDGNGSEVQRATLAVGSPLDRLLTVAAAPYTVRLTQNNYSDPNIYVLKADLQRAFSQHIPYIPKSGDWSGFALTNPGNAAVEGVSLTTRDADGMPIHTVLGPLTLKPGEKRVFLFDDLPVRRTEFGKTDALTLEADGPVDLLNLIGSGETFLAAFVQGEARGSRLVIPDTVVPRTQGVRMFGGIKNESFEEADVVLRIYSREGDLQQEVTETIAGRGTFSIRPGSSPFYNMPPSGWIEVQGKGAAPLSGFQYMANASGVESLFALPVDGVKKFVSHIPEPGYWTTTLTLINPNSRQNSVRLHPALAGADTAEDIVLLLAPHEKRVMELQEPFGKYAGDPLYHSILEITGTSPLAGYVSYGVLNGTDIASYPLLDESALKSALTLPHYPGNDGYWWTGVVVFNPSDAPQTARIEPYGHDRKLMAGHERTVDLAPGAYEVFEVGAFFGESASGISFLKVTTEGDSGAIGGFYMYGNSGSRILSGSTL